MCERKFLWTPTLTNLPRSFGRRAGAQGLAGWPGPTKRLFHWEATAALFVLCTALQLMKRAEYALKIVRVNRVGSRLYRPFFFLSIFLSVSSTLSFWHWVGIVSNWEKWGILKLGPKSCRQFPWPEAWSWWEGPGPGDGLRLLWVLAQLCYLWWLVQLQSGFSSL